MGSFTTPPLTEVIKSYQGIMAAFLPQGESSAVPDACAVPTASEETCTQLFIQTAQLSEAITTKTALELITVFLIRVI